jgi:hypothetical protein
LTGIVVAVGLDEQAVDVLPFRYRESVPTRIFVRPAGVLLGVFRVRPLIDTIFIGFEDRFSQKFVGAPAGRGRSPSCSRPSTPS